MQKWSSRGRGLLALGILALLAGARTSRGDEPPPWHKWRIREWKGKQPIGRGTTPHTFERAGNPNEVSRCAITNDTPNYCGYYVGGGAHRRGIPLQYTGESESSGTWGWDYSGLKWLRSRVALTWNPRRRQGGLGSYRTDGPVRPKDPVPLLVETITEGPLRRHREESHGEGHGNGHGEGHGQTNGHSPDH